MTRCIKVDRSVVEIYLHKIDKKNIDKLRERK